ncbi:ankyrin repeat domain-containing protein 63 [Dendrobates tinctorius]|uniref:ankyrin repeat domain-containing protein 63 n=1 Tax=Dendrobates tinctorius TaxID=92724 RepID=UPI003CCA0A34
MLRPRDLRRSSGTRTFLDAMHGGKVHLARFVLDALDRRIVNSPAGEQGRTPLMFAVCLKEAELRSRFVRLLLDKGADVNGQDEAGRTALSLACELGHLDAVKLLVQHSADPEIADRDGNRALMYAASCGHSAELLFLLRSYKRFGLRLDATNRAGISALDAARVSGHWECERALSGRGRDREPTARSPKPLSRHVLQRFSRPFSHRREDEDSAQPRRAITRSASCSPAHAEALPEKATLPVPEAGIQRAHSWDGSGTGGTSQCSRLLRRGTSPDFCQELPRHLGDMRAKRSDSSCSRSQLLPPDGRQALAL